MDFLEAFWICMTGINRSMPLFVLAAVADSWMVFCTSLRLLYSVYHILSTIFCLLYSVYYTLSTILCLLYCHYTLSLYSVTMLCHYRVLPWLNG